MIGPVKQQLVLDSQNPWPGLATYDENAKDYFFGREDETEELLRLIKLSPLTVLYGKSGLGKSSLLQAGLFPKLRASYYLPVYIRLDYASCVGSPFINQAAYWFRQALQASGAEYPEFPADDSLWCYLHRRDLEIWSPDNHLLTPIFVFDQFEEVFAGTNPSFPPPRVLCSDLADLIENKIPAECTLAARKSLLESLDLLAQRYRVLLSFREDYLPALKNWEADVPSLLKSWCQLKSMSREHAVAAVAQSGAAIVAAGVAEEIVDFVGNLDKSRLEGDTCIEPVLLSLCCYQLNVRRQANKAVAIDTELLRKVGQEILEDYYSKALDNMPKSVAKFIENYLIQGDRYRSSYPEKLAIEEQLITPRQLAELTDLHRLLRVEQHLGTARIELIHDRLVSVVRQARDRRRSRTELRRAWIITATAILLAVLFSAWLKWQESINTERIVDTLQLRLSHSFCGQLAMLPEHAENWGSNGQVPALENTQAHRIYLQIRDAKQLGVVKQLQELLIKQKYVVPDIQTLNTGPNSTEVRYFRDADANEAQQIADLLTQKKVQAVTAKYIAGFENSKSIPKGQFEIWFAPDALP